MKLEVYTGTGMGLSGGLGGGKNYAAAIVRCKNLDKNIVQPFNQRWSGAEVRLERDEVKEERV